MTIGVTGATGQLGRLVLEKLKGKTSQPVAALARSPGRAAGLGVDVREADYEKPLTLKAALAGIDTLMLISASELGKRVEQHRNAIAAAKAAGVKRIVYTSLLHADTSPIDLAAEHRVTEAELRASGIACTILRNGWYTENYTDAIGGALASGAYIGTSGEGRISSAPRADYAEAAVATLTRAGEEGKIYELAGDSAYTLADLAAEISRQTGKAIPYKNLPEAEYAAILASFGLPGPVAKAIAGWGVDASRGALFDDSHALSALIGRPTTPLSASVREALAALPKS